MCWATTGCASVSPGGTWVFGFSANSGKKITAASSEMIIAIAAMNSINERCGNGKPESVIRGTDNTPAIVTAPRTPDKPDNNATRQEAVSFLWFFKRTHWLMYVQITRIPKMTNQVMTAYSNAIGNDTEFPRFVANGNSIPRMTKI